MDTYSDLAAAIIEQAARDYYDIVEKLPQLTIKVAKKKAKQLKRIVDFFNSEWYHDLAYLCNFQIKGEELIKILNQKVKDGIPMGRKQYV